MNYKTIILNRSLPYILINNYEFVYLKNDETIGIVEELHDHMLGPNYNFLVIDDIITELEHYLDTHEIYHTDNISFTIKGKHLNEFQILLDSEKYINGMNYKNGVIEMLRDGAIYRGLALETIPSFLFVLKLIKRIKQYDIGWKNEKS